MLRGKERSKEPELEEIDLESLELEAVEEAPEPSFSAAAAEPETALRGPPGPENWSRARNSLADIQRDLDAIAAANEAAVGAAEARADDLARENDRLRNKLEESERRINELESFKRNLKQILDQ